MPASDVTSYGQFDETCVAFPSDKWISVKYLANICKDVNITSLCFAKKGIRTLL